MKTYEYKVLIFQTGMFLGAAEKEVEALIAPHAREGWRVASTAMDAHHLQLFIFLERERQEKPAQAPAQATACATGQKPAQAPRQAPVQAPRLKPLPPIPPVPPHAPRPRH